jgi:DivIVA domain-containing protein
MVTCGFVLAVFARNSPTALGRDRAQWARHAPASVLAAYLVVVMLASIWVLYRGWRMGVRFDDRGVRVRKFLATDRFGWHEVSRFSDGYAAFTYEGGVHRHWALNVVLHDGRIVRVKATARDGSASPRMLAAIRQVAERYGIPAELAGVARWRPHASVEESPSESARSGAGGIILSERAASGDFSTTRLRPGYDIEEVDAFLEAIRQTFLGMREPTLTVDDIRNKKFSTTRLRPGYDEEEVDAFLDSVELRLAALTRPGGDAGL